MEVSIEQDHRKVGVCRWQEEGPRVRFICTLFQPLGLCKLWLYRGERQVLLGTPIPVNAGMELARVFSRQELEKQNVYPPERVLCMHAGQRNLPEPVFGDRFLKRLLSSGEWRRSERSEGMEFTHLWPAGTPFPVPALFCFCSVIGSNEKRRVSLLLDENGNPKFP